MVSEWESYTGLRRHFTLKSQSPLVFPQGNIGVLENGCEEHDGKSTSYVWTRAHLRIRSLRVVKNDRTGTYQGLEPHHPTM